MSTEEINSGLVVRGSGDGQVIIAEQLCPEYTARDNILTDKEELFNNDDFISDASKALKSSYSELYQYTRDYLKKVVQAYKNNIRVCNLSLNSAVKALSEYDKRLENQVEKSNVYKKACEAFKNFMVESSELINNSLLVQDYEEDIEDNVYISSFEQAEDVVNELLKENKEQADKYLSEKILISAGGTYNMIEEYFKDNNISECISTALIKHNEYVDKIEEALKEKLSELEIQDYRHKYKSPIREDFNWDEDLKIESVAQEEVKTHEVSIKALSVSFANEEKYLNNEKYYKREIEGNFIKIYRINEIKQLKEVYRAFGDEIDKNYQSYINNIKNQIYTLSKADEIVRYFHNLNKLKNDYQGNHKVLFKEIKKRIDYESITVSKALLNKLYMKNLAQDLISEECREEEMNLYKLVCDNIEKIELLSSKGGDEDKCLGSITKYTSEVFKEKLVNNDIWAKHQGLIDKRNEQLKVDLKAIEERELSERILGKISDIWGLKVVNKLKEEKAAIIKRLQVEHIAEGCEKNTITNITTELMKKVLSGGGLEEHAKEAGLKIRELKVKCDVSFKDYNELIDAIGVEGFNIELYKSELSRLIRVNSNLGYEKIFERGKIDEKIQVGIDKYIYGINRELAEDHKERINNLIVTQNEFNKAIREHEELITSEFKYYKIEELLIKSAEIMKGVIEDIKGNPDKYAQYKWLKSGSEIESQLIAGIKKIVTGCSAKQIILIEQLDMPIKKVFESYYGIFFKENNYKAVKDNVFELYRLIKSFVISKDDSCRLKETDLLEALEVTRVPLWNHFIAINGNTAKEIMSTDEVNGEKVLGIETAATRVRDVIKGHFKKYHSKILSSSEYLKLTKDFTINRYNELIDEVVEKLVKIERLVPKISQEGKKKMFIGILAEYKARFEEYFDSIGVIKEVL